MLAFDCGPPADWATLFAQAPLSEYVNHPSQRFRTAFGAVYFRGRLDGTARVLVVGQDPSSDETLAQRILVGSAGQLVQGFLIKLGLEQSYVMLNTFLFGITGQFDSQMRSISHSGPIQTYRNALFDHVKSGNALQAVLAFGDAAQDAVATWSGAGALSVFQLMHPTARTGVTENWNTRLGPVSALVPADPGNTPDLTPYGTAFAPADMAPIPRHDLPFGLPDWHGTGGTHSTRLSPTKIAWSVQVP